MPIPQTSTWPPEQLDVILPAMYRWDAWYASRTDRLAAIYANGEERPSFQRDGLVGTVRRFFWGTSGSDAPQKKLHVPVASDLCQASADLLFAEPPTLTVDDVKAQERLDLIIGEDAHDQLASGAEVGAALGGTYVRVAWDQDLAPHPFLARVDADHALPEFTWGRLSAVTFWRTVATEGGTIWRHLERHESRDGVGVIEHALFRGTSATLGKRRPLIENTATAGLTTAEDGVVSTLTPGLDVVYVPNQSPNRVWRDHPLGANLGRSDLDGLEPLLDALDETWSSWMRDLRIGKGRIVAAQSALDDNGPGKGATLDLDREVYEALNTPPGAANQSGLPMEHVQFAIRVQEHQDTAAALLAQILRTAGYSSQTFGDDASGAAMTATEVHSRERRSFLTRDRKIRPWRPALAQLARKALAIDQVVFRSGVDADQVVNVEFGDTVQEAQEALARTAQLMHQAQAASTRTRVQMLHPDWDDATVDEEVERIGREFGEPAPDPDALGRGGFALGDSFQQQEPEE
ncbi:MAG: phage portal protein [Brachybacterium sp.]|uniref:phage portal protein n=1 Tax=Brachybacterium sp. TaxID=1891286 RepID=UPI00264759CF|nr:phage portal protein [Brachybacterium sp.]MDN5687015.1 phage portal protein [Brachybacterium sp.]